MRKIPVISPDVAVLDDWLPDGNGIGLCRELLSCMLDLRCLILTSHTSDEAMLNAILAGASGYVVKDIRGMGLACAIKDVGAGRSLLDTQAAAALMARLWWIIENSDGMWAFNDRERTLLGLPGDGLTNGQIADPASLAEEVVRNHVSRLLVKLGVSRQPNHPYRQWF
jgi:two-component system, NarL family, response regulator DevR